MTAADQRSTRAFEPPYLLTTTTHRRGTAVTASGDATASVVELALYGEWSPPFGDQVSASLRLCLAGPTVSIIVDLQHLTDAAGLSLPFWMAAWRQARLAPSPVRLVFCLPDRGALSRQLRRADGPRPRVFAGVPEAQVAIAAMMSPADRWQAQLRPHPACVRTARDLVRHACRAWHLEHLADDAMSIVSELAGNAVEHAGTDFVVTVSRGAARLHMAVQDSAPAFIHHRMAAVTSPGPLHDRGRGLPLVHAIAAAWGAMPARGGKVVWASLA